MSTRNVIFLNIFTLEYTLEAAAYILVTICIESNS